MKLRISLILGILICIGIACAYIYPYFAKNYYSFKGMDKETVKWFYSTVAQTLGIMVTLTIPLGYSIVAMKKKRLYEMLNHKLCIDNKDIEFEKAELENSFTGAALERRINANNKVLEGVEKNFQIRIPGTLYFIMAAKLRFKVNGSQPAVFQSEKPILFPQICQICADLTGLL